MLNINGKQDVNYRYKMPAIKSSIAGKGNGIFTTFQNLNDVGKYLNHPGILLLKFMSTFNGSMANEDKMTMTGGYSNEEHQNALQVYINRFVICPKCGVPETIPQLKKENKKTNILELKCSSCGTLSSVIYNNKMEMKAGELIIKYLEKNEWSVQSKGTMVKQSNNESILLCVESEIIKEKTEDQYNEEEYNPFT
jgi:translation initiation factor 5